MKGNYTEQEEFWVGTFGDEYTQRNQGKYLHASNLALFSKIFSRTEKVSSVIEFGANIGLNLLAIKALRPEIEINAVEINESAVKQLKKLDAIKVFHQSILDFSPESEIDFVFTKGVLIHIDPDKLSDVYDLLVKTSSRYICIAEYYNPTPVEISYRGHKGKLFKRDFAGEIMKKYPDINLIDYGFIYHRDPVFPQDDITWFLLKK